jgi:hypothetical protein
MRTGWGARDAVVTFDCGPVGHGAAGHGHADALSVQLHAAGYPFLIDPGTFSYNIDYAWRDAFRGTPAHNTVVVDGEDQSIVADRMSWKTQARCQARRFVASRNLDLVDGGHDGYRRYADPVGHRRVLICVRPGTWVIWDSLQAVHRHRYDLLFHLRPDCSVSLEAGRARFVLASPDGHRLCGHTLDASGQPLPVDVIKGSERERRAWFSPEYGVRVPSRALLVARDSVGGDSLITCLSTSALTLPVAAVDSGTLRVRVGEGAAGTRLYYGIDGRCQVSSSGLAFDGELLFERGGQTCPTVEAHRFRRVTLDSVVDVAAPDDIASLTLEGDRCEIRIDPAHIAGLRLKARSGIHVLVNGRSVNEQRMVRF